MRCAAILRERRVWWHFTWERKYRCQLQCTGHGEQHEHIERSTGTTVRRTWTDT